MTESWPNDHYINVQSWHKKDVQKWRGFTSTSGVAIYWLVTKWWVFLFPRRNWFIFHSSLREWTVILKRSSFTFRFHDLSVTYLNIILHMEIVDDEWVVKIGILDGLVQWEALWVEWDETVADWPFLHWLLFNRQNGFEVPPYGIM